MGIHSSSLDHITGEEDQVRLTMPDTKLLQVIDKRVDNNFLLARLALTEMEIAYVENADEIWIGHPFVIKNIW